jgi:hypothetical protein
MTSNVKIIQVSAFHHVSIYKDSNAYILQCFGPHGLKMASVRNEDGMKDSNSEQGLIHIVAC